MPHPVQPLSTLRTPRCRDARKTCSRPACSALNGPDFHWQAHSSFLSHPATRSLLLARLVSLFGAEIADAVVGVAAVEVGEQRVGFLRSDRQHELAELHALTNEDLHKWKDIVTARAHIAERRPPERPGRYFDALANILNLRLEPDDAETAIDNLKELYDQKKAWDTRKFDCSYKSAGFSMGLRAALDYVRQGDVLIVWKLDRLGRSLPHLIETVTSLATRGVGFCSLTEAIDTTTPGGRLGFHVFGALGQFERDLIRERTRGGLVAAATRPKGRP